MFVQLTGYGKEQTREATKLISQGGGSEDKYEVKGCTDRALKLELSSLTPLNPYWEIFRSTYAFSR